MRVLLSGNEAIARGAWEQGVKVASAYPGTPSTEILETLSTFDEVYTEWAPNEKVALEVAIGASLAGARALAAMKHVGLNVAADPFFTLSYTGVNAGLVVVSADDPSLYSSQNEQDNRHYAKMAKVPMLEPSDSEECRFLMREAYFISEFFDTPLLFRITTRIAHSKGVVQLEERFEPPLKEASKEPKKWVMLPTYAEKKHPLVEERLKRLKKYSEGFAYNKEEIKDKNIGFITSGISYQYVKEAFPEASVFKVTLSYPLPVERIREFASRVKKLYVVEELDPFMETELKASGIEVIGKEIFPICKELSPEIVKSAVDKNYKASFVSFSGIPSRPPTLCPGCPHRGVFVVLRKLKLMAFGDIGCYTLGALPPLSSLHTCICMGAGIGMVHGAEKAGVKGVALIGDSTFYHSGITGVIDILYNKGGSTVIIMDNGTTAMTGRQGHPGTGITSKGEMGKKVELVSLLKGLGFERIRVVDPYDLDELEKVLKEEVAAEEPSIVITKRDCTLVSKTPKEPFEVDEGKCIGCGICLKVGCIAISHEHEKAHIDPTLCFGCGICAKVCPKDAIKRSQ